MEVDQNSASQGKRCDIQAIHEFWDGVLKRLKVHAEVAAAGARPTTVTNPDSTRQIDGDKKQPG
jgi:hypothetical protein